MSSHPASRARALALTALLLPLAALVALPTASADTYWKEDWESGTDGWSLTGSFSKQDCATRYAGACSLKLDPPCALSSAAYADFPNRGGNGAALSFAMKAVGTGDTQVVVDVDLIHYDGHDVGGIKLNIGFGDGMNVQIFSEGYGSAPMVNVPSIVGWYIVSLRVESMDGTTWVDVWNAATHAKLASTNKVGYNWNSEPSDVRLTASTPVTLNDPTCTARAFWFDEVRLGNAYADAPIVLTSMATKSSVALTLYPLDPGAMPVTSYRIWRSTNGGPETEVGSTTTTAYTDNTVQPGNTYVYRARARNAYGDGPLGSSGTVTTWGFGEEWENGTSGWTVSPTGVSQDCAVAVSGCSIALAPNGSEAQAARTFNQVMTGRFQASFWYRPTPGASPTDARFSLIHEGPWFWGTFATLHLTDGADGLGLRVEAGTQSATVPHAPAADAWTRVALLVEPQSGMAWAEVRDVDDNVLAASTAVPIDTDATSITRIAFRSSSSGASPATVRVDGLRTGYPPGAPTSLDGAGGFRSAQLTWVKPTELGSGSLSGFRIYRSVPGGTPEPIATLGAAATSYSDSGLADDTTYEYAVATLTTSGLGPRSSVKALHTDRVSEGFESALGDWTVSDPASAAVSCSLAHAGACSLRLDPVTRGVQVDAVRALDSPITGSFQASAWIRTDRAPAATDVTFRLAFESGNSVDVEILRSGATTGDVWRLRMGGNAWLLGTGISANAWHEIRLFVVPDGSHVKAEIRGADGRIVSATGPFYFPSGWWTGADLAEVGFHAKEAASGTTAIVHVDDVRVHDTLMSRPSTHLTKKDSAVGVTWWGHSGPTAVTGFRVYAGPNGAALQKVADLAPTASAYTVRNLADGSALVNGQNYCVAVGVLTAYGESPASVTSCMTPQGVPDAPRNLRATNGANKVTLAWDAPEYPGDPPATQYCVDRRANTWTAPAIELGCASYGVRTYVDSTAVGNVRYYYTVRAKNTVGSSADSNMVLGQPTLT